MKYIRNIFNRHFYRLMIFTVFIPILLVGCAKSSLNTIEKNTTSETERISESLDVQNEEDQKQKEDVGKKAKVVKNSEDEAMKLAKKKLAEQKSKQAEINILTNHLKSVNKILKGQSFTAKLHSKKYKQAVKLAEECLIKLNTEPLGFDKLSNANVILLKAKTLHLLQKDKEAVNILLKNWGSIILPDKDLQKTGSLNKVPSAEGYYLKGQIFLKLARNESDKALAQALYKQAIKSYYAVLSLYDANKCSFSALSVKGFTECRKEMHNRFKIKVGFPPEF